MFSQRMLSLRPALGLVLALAVASPVLAGPKPQTIELFQSSDRVVVMLKIGDHAPLPAVFDTGTNGNLIDLDVANHLKLRKTGPSRSVDGSTGKPVAGYETVFTGASLGGVPIVDGTATVFKWKNPNEVAIVGPNSFPGKFVVMDLARSRLTILTEKPASAANDPGIPYKGKEDDRLPALTFTLNGQPVSAILDSGNDSDFLLPLTMVDALPLETKPVKIGEAVSAAGSQPVYEARLKGDVTIAGVVIPHPRLRFMAGGDPNIGLPVMRRLKLMFDHTNGRTWVLGEAAASQPPR